MHTKTAKYNVGGLILLVLAMGGVLQMECSRQEIVVVSSAALREQAIEESGRAIRPGEPGKRPFWNVHATRFIYAPAFGFREIEGATSYAFVAHCAGDTSFRWQVDKPWRPIPEKIWRHMPVGYVSLSVTALARDGEVLQQCGARRFYRAAVFDGLRELQRGMYLQSAKRGLEFLYRSSWLRHWLERGEPDPHYSLYCYPSKMVAAVIEGMLLFADLVPEHADTALAIARRAADYLISISEPPTSLLPHFPPTYDEKHIRPDIDYANDVDMPWGRRMSRANAGKIMLIYPAEVGIAYLDLYARTRIIKYRNAAWNIAETYLRVQDEEGRWPLLMDVQTGERPFGTYANPTGIVSLLRRVRIPENSYRYDRAIDKAERIWMDKMAAFDFEAQFEDQGPAPRYENQANGPALETAMRFFGKARIQPEMASLADEYLRFAEDQFVVWSDPVPEPRPGESSESWFIFPCALEKYQCYQPIDAHAANFCLAYVTAYRATGKVLYLAKAVALANSITRAQDPKTGRFPTWWKRHQIDAPGWLNCAVLDAKALVALDSLLGELNIRFVAEGK